MSDEHAEHRREVLQHMPHYEKESTQHTQNSTHSLCMVVIRRFHLTIVILRVALASTNIRVANYTTRFG